MKINFLKESKNIMEFWSYEKQRSFCDFEENNFSEMLSQKTREDLKFFFCEAVLGNSKFSILSFCSWLLISFWVKIFLNFSTGKIRKVPMFKFLSSDSLNFIFTNSKYLFRSVHPEKIWIFCLESNYSIHNKSKI